MNVFALFSLLAFLVTVFLGNLVLFRNPRNALNRVFFLFCFSGALWSLAEFGYRQAESFATAYFWLKASFLWPLTLAFELHFILLFAERTKLLENKLTYFLLYGPALALSLLHLINLLGSEPVKAYWGWTYSQPENQIVNGVLTIWLFGIILFSSYLCLHYYLKTTERNKKRQAKYVLAGFSMTTVMGLATEVLPYYLKIKIPESTSIGFIFECIFVGYAVWKYKLFALTPATAAESILSTMTDALLLVSPERKIVTVNQTALELLGYKERDLIGQSVEMILAQEEKARFKEAWFETLATVGSISDTEAAFKTKDARKIPTSLSASVMRGEDGAELGIVCVCRDLTERKRAEEQVRTSLREKSVLLEAGAILSSTLDSGAVLSRIAGQMGRAVDATSAYISSYEPGTMRSSVLAEYIGPKACPQERVSDLGASYVEDAEMEWLEIMQAGQHDISHIDDPGLTEFERAHMQQFGAKTILYIPLRVRGQLIGYTELWESRRRREFTPEEIALCQGIAQQAAIALENAQLYERAQQEIAERKQAEEQIKASLREKEVLLKEIHHRVKNNLQVISSLLYLQSKNIKRKETLSAFQDSRNRVRSMALVHEWLYQSQDLARIDFAEYIQSLTNHLFRSYGVNTNVIQLKINMNNVFLGVDIAIPCGLIINELVSNCLKHAFPDGREGQIRIELWSENDGGVTLIVSDDGVGFPQDLDFRNTQSVGLQLVNNLAVVQLGGTVELDRNGGTAFKITFTGLE